MALFRNGQNVIYVCLVLSLFVGSLNAECCKDGETKIDEDDCTKYQVCCTGEFVSKSCQNGTYWDPETELCQIDNGECRPPTPCVDGETEVDADDCTKYFVCCHGELVSKSCDNGYYWNSDAQECDLDNGQCKPPTCENGEVNPNPEDCAGYQECVNGAWVNQSCSAGDYFNSTLNKCVLDTCGACVNCVEGSKKPDQYDCAKFQICVNGKYVSESCPIGEYFNSAINDCEQDNGQCNGNQTCTEDEIQADVGDCAGYEVCSNGSWVSRQCPDGAYFDENLNFCTPDTEGICLNCTDGDLQVYPSDCTKFKICTNGKYVVKSCDSGDYWNSATKKCEIDNGQCNGNQTCTEGDIQEDAEDCAGYEVCSNGSWVSRQCPDGAYFDENLNFCTPDTEGICLNCTDGDLQVYPSDCTKFKICTNGKYVVKSCDSGDYWNSATKKCEIDNGQCNGNQTCTEGDIQEDAEDCAGYEVCSNGIWVSRKCPTGEYFNVTDSTCIIDESGVCLNCTEGTTGPVPSDCTKYKICAGGKYVVQSCAGGLYFNNQTNRCEIDNGECVVVPSCKESEVEVNPADCAGFLECINGNFVARKCAATLFFNTTLMECVKDTENVCIPKDCDPECCENPNGPTLPVANNCSAFIQCVDGKVFQHTCAGNLQYNPETKDCDYPWVVGCEDGAPPPIAGPSGTYCESHGNCINERDGAMFASCSKPCSSSYVVCQCECEVNFTCSAGLIFNPAIKVCDWPQNVKC
ncbi:uncharacterized protein Dana_GF25304 [Drosophila ananassae]|uniref:Chitin-binding type-2 domain-containing protein n=2 Tax=Drosophila ananassae TaxID=7217 RepID=B3M4M6_DROAN|nr:uncharacterized protein Dana_GF25304 [Drosophila ananassae]